MPRYPGICPVSRRLVAHTSRKAKWPPSTRASFQCPTRAQIGRKGGSPERNGPKPRRRPSPSPPGGKPQVDRGLAPNKSAHGDLAGQDTADMCKAGKPPRQSKAAKLATLTRDLGKKSVCHLRPLGADRLRQAARGAGPRRSTAPRLARTAWHDHGRPRPVPGDMLMPNDRTARVKAITGVAGRRSWPAEEKLRIVEGSLASAAACF